jgi:hypothetical protein
MGYKDKTRLEQLGAQNCMGIQRDKEGDLCFRGFIFRFQRLGFLPSNFTKPIGEIDTS